MDLPEAYKRGFQDFYGRDFFVSPDVLIPRPETEAAIDEVLLLAGKPYLSGMKVTERKLPKNPVIFDVGTGSGCIAITLKLEIPEAEVVAIDISEKALTVAQKNAEKLQANVEFLKSDLLSNYQGKTPDVIVANLPYVDKDWEWLDKEALSVEPELALFANNRGLELIFRLIDQIEAIKTNKKMWIILEADPCQHAAIIEYARSKGLAHQKTSGFQLVFGKD